MTGAHDDMQAGTPGTPGTHDDTERAIVRGLLFGR